jgi:hypothetical protein
MKKTLHALALASLVVSATGCAPQDAAPEESGILDEYVKDAPVTEERVKESTKEEAVQSTESSVSGAETSSYKDGSYSANGPYQSPAGAETMGVTLTLKDGLVTSVSITAQAENEVSLQLQNAFANGISALVVGKSLDEIGGYSAVNGASLTPKGFDAAVAQIRSLAQ